MFHGALTRTAAIWGKHRAVLRAVEEGWAGDPELRDAWLDAAGLFSAGLAALIERDRAAGIAAPGPPAGRLSEFILWSVQRCFYLAALDAEKGRAGEMAAVDTIFEIAFRAAYGRGADRA